MSGVVDIANIATQTVTQSADFTPPVVSSATVSGNTLIIKLTDDSHLNTTTAPAGAYTVMVNGVVDVVQCATVFSDVDLVMLSLTTPVTHGQSVSVSYTDPTTANDTYALQDNLGNDVASFSLNTVQLIGVSA